MNRLRSWMGAHPIAAFVLLAFGISYLVGGPVLMAGMGMIPARAPLLRTYLPRILVVYGPALAALLLARVASANGPATLLRRVAPSGKDVAVAAAALLACALAWVTAVRVSGVSMAELSQAVRAGAGLLVAHLALQVAGVALGEELGWRGWLLPQLAARTSRLRAALITGIIWGVWHAPLLLSGLASAATFLLFVIALSVLFTWLWAHARGGLFTVIVAHASVNAPMFFWEQVSGGTRESDERIRRGWLVLQGMYIVAGVVLVLARWQWWKANDGAAESVVIAQEHSSRGEDRR